MPHKKSVKKQKIIAVILAGRHDFGRCPVAMRHPTALWPIGGKTALDRLLSSLAEQGIKQTVICSNSDGPLLANSIEAESCLGLKFLDEELPVGTAGCIRDAVGDEKNALIVVFPAGIVCPPKVDVLIKAHRAGQAELTIMFNPIDRSGKVLGEPAGIYVCETGIIKNIPKQGYFDIKEGLIPEMLHVGKNVHTAVLPYHVGNFRDRQEYLYAVAGCFEGTGRVNEDLAFCKRDDSKDLWVASDATVEPGARLFGPVTVMDRAHISEGAVVFGPTVVGRDVNIGPDTVVVNSVLWDGAKIGPNCQVRRCLIDYNADVRANTFVEEKAIPFRPKGMLRECVNGASNRVKNSITRFQQVFQSRFGKINEFLSDYIQTHRAKIVLSCLIGLFSIAFIWSYWPGLKNLWDVWQRNDEYSSGLLVPVLTVYILWTRRDDICECPVKPFVWGIFVIIVAHGLRLFGLYFGYGSAEDLSIVLSIAGLVLFIFGWRFFRKVATVLLFLCLMLPWPARVQAAIALPLQSLATSSAVFCLETIGYEVVKEGHLIHINQATVAIAEACNGLRMITAFFVISGLVVLLVKQQWWVKLIILASSLPIALMCNTIRLTITSMAFTVLNGEYWEKIFHDFGGYAMMPLALAAVVAELWLLVKLTKLPVKEEPIIITRQKP